MEFFAPSISGESEINEKRSRFIGRVYPVFTENEAKTAVDGAKAQYQDARHNPWCYLLPDGTSRSSDEGEPKGTSGPPMLEMLKRENIRAAAIVVTRYFGGVLLGPGGLARAYTAAAKAALNNSGLMLYVTKVRVITVSPYSVSAKIKHEMSACGGVEERSDYADYVTLYALFDADKVSKFCSNIVEITAGAVIPEIVEETLVPAE